MVSLESADIVLGTAVSCRKSDEQIEVIGLDLCLVRRFVSDDLPASVTAVRDDKAALRVGVASKRAKKPAAGVGAVAREQVNVQRAETERAMVARAVSERKHGLSAVLADEAVIVFLKSLGFHNKSFLI